MPERAVVVAGSRTPFARAFAQLHRLDAIELAKAAVGGLLSQTELKKEDIDAVRWGGVVLPSASPNIARELAIDLDLPSDAEAMTVTRACASGLQAVTSGVELIERGHAEVVIAGGGDSSSNFEVALPSHVIHAFAPLALGKGMGFGGWMNALGQFVPPWKALPRAPKVAERSTGEVMGESAEKMAEIHRITRQAQDELALMSQQRAHAAWESGFLKEEVAPMDVPGGAKLTHDTLIRKDTSLEKLAKLRPVFQEDGTLTAGNSTALTDGAAAVLLMSESKAKALGFQPLAAFKSWAYVGVDPRDQLLIGPALAMPLALKRAQLDLEDMDLIDIHEAFAAVVLCCLKAMEDPAFCKDRLGRSQPLGIVDWDRLNVYGGSIALGHPFAATGARMVTTMARGLHDSPGRKHALLGICAAGGLGAAAVLERV